MRISDRSSDVCSSDLCQAVQEHPLPSQLYAFENSVTPPQGAPVTFRRTEVFPSSWLPSIVPGAAHGLATRGLAPPTDYRLQTWTTSFPFRPVPSLPAHLCPKQCWRFAEWWATRRCRRCSNWI